MSNVIKLRLNVSDRTRANKKTVMRISVVPTTVFIKTGMRAWQISRINILLKKM